MAIILGDQIDERTVLNKKRFFNVLDEVCSSCVQKETKKKTDVSAPSLPELFSNMRGIQDVRRLFAH
jgi:hypothetical protein